MASDFQEDKLKKRKEELEARREYRKNPELRKQQPRRGLGSKRTQTPQKTASQTALSAPKGQVPPSAAAMPPTPPQPPPRRDRIELSDEALLRFKEKCEQEQIPLPSFYRTHSSFDTSRVNSRNPFVNS